MWKLIVKKRVYSILTVLIGLICCSCNNSSDTVISPGREPIAENVRLIPLPASQRFGLVPIDVQTEDKLTNSDASSSSTDLPNDSSQLENISTAFPGGFITPSITWEAPVGWEEAPKKPMRVVTFRSKNEEQWECYVSIISSQAGGIEANLKRWANQMGKGEFSIDISKLPKISMFSQNIPLFEIEGTYTSMQGESKENYKLLGTVCTLSEMTVFVKMVGPIEQVERQKDNFIKFCESLKIEANKNAEIIQ